MRRTHLLERDRKLKIGVMHIIFYLLANLSRQRIARRELGFIARQKFNTDQFVIGDANTDHRERCGIFRRIVNRIHFFRLSAFAKGAFLSGAFCDIALR